MQQILKKITIILVLVASCLLFYWATYSTSSNVTYRPFYQNMQTWSQIKENKEQYQVKPFNRSALPKKIIYPLNTLWGKRRWGRDDLDKECPELHCRVSYDEMELNISDAVVLHGWGSDMPSPEKLKAIRKTVPQKQLWIFTMAEAPINRYAYNEVFNWTASYRTDSEVYTPFGMYERKQHEDILKNYAEGELFTLLVEYLLNAENVKNIWQVTSS